MLIQLQEKEPCFGNYFWFFFLTIITFSFLYRCYININSVERTVTIKKLISNTNNLLIDTKYDKYNPTFQYLNKTYKYGQDNNNIDKNVQNEVSNNENNENKLPDNNNINKTNINNEVVNINQIHIEVHPNNSLSSERKITDTNNK